MTDLASWLLAQIADDEAAARAAIRADRRESGHWYHPNEPWAGQVEDRGSNDLVVYDEGSPTNEQALHIARHDPARVLAECAAKRAIVEQHPCDDEGYCGDNIGLVGCKWLWPCPTLRLLPQPYAGRPGWDPAWKVET